MFSLKWNNCFPKLSLSATFKPKLKKNKCNMKLYFTKKTVFRFLEKTNPTNNVQRIIVWHKNNETNKYVFFGRNEKSILSDNLKRYSSGFSHFYTVLKVNIILKE